MASVSVAHAFPHGGEKEVYVQSGTGGDPTSGSYWATTVAAFTGTILGPYATIDYGVSVPPSARSWWCWEHAVSSPAETADQNQEFYIFGNGTWEFRGQFEDADPPTYYTIRMYHITDGLIGESTTQFGLGAATWRQCRFTWLSGQVALEVQTGGGGRTVEINVGTPRAIPDAAVNYFFGGGVGGFSATNIFLRKVVVVRGDSGADRPDETTQTYTACEIKNNANGTHTAWASVGAVAFDSETYEDWDGGGANDGNTTYIYPPGTSTVIETAQLDAQPGITSDEHALMVHHYCRITGTPGGSKHLGDSLICDGGGHSDSALTLGGAADGNFRTKAAMFKFAPDGGTWVAADAANLEIGVRGAGTAVPTGVLHTAIWGEWCGYDLDAGDPPSLAWAQGLVI